MSPSRRVFLKQSAGVAGMLVLSKKIHQRQQEKIARPTLDPNMLAKFVDPLPILPIARPRSKKAARTRSSLQVPYFRLPMREFTCQVHRDLKPTRVWGFGTASPGPTIETRSGEGLLVGWANELPGTHFLPIDHGIHGAEESMPDVRTVIHLHGAKVPPEGDGYPENWYVPGKSATYFYPNEQEAAML
jgi:spore coat protein A, manganese oxidase